MPHRRLYALAETRPLRQPTQGRATAMPAADLAWLRQHVHGDVIAPADAAYATQREGFNPRYNPHPAAIAIPGDEVGLRACLAFARRLALPLAIRGGGHSFNGRSNSPGLVIDMRRFDAITIAGEVVTVGAGCPQGILRDTLAQHRLHLPLGDSAQVAIGGFMQGGGYGHSARCFGMNCDHVIAVRVMLADGRVVRADDDTNADLFWAIRGGAGGGLGVLLEITYRAHPNIRLATDSLTWRLHTEAERAAGAAVLAMVARDYTGQGATGTALEVIVAHGVGAQRGPWMFVDATHHGNAKGLQTALAPLVALAPPVADPGEIATRRPGAMPAMSRQGRYLRTAPDSAFWQALLGLMDGAQAHGAAMYFTTHGDAIDAVARESCAFIHRTACGLLTQDVFWHDPAGEAPALMFQNRWADRVAPLWNGRCYQNFSNEALVDYRAAYWGEAFAMLLAVRGKYDPRFFLAGAQDISPDPARPAPPALWPPHVADALSLPIAG